MKFSVGVIGAVVLSTAAAGVTAEEQGDSSSLLCAVTYTVSVNLPVFLKFDSEKKVVESARQGGERRTSNIVHMGTAGDVMVFLGDEGDSAWSATINKSTGSLTGTVSEQGVGYVIFGSCLGK